MSETATQVKFAACLREKIAPIKTPFNTKIQDNMKNPFDMKGMESNGSYVLTCG